MHKQKHHRLSRYLWFLVSTAAVITIFFLASSHRTFLGYASCADPQQNRVTFSAEYEKQLEDAGVSSRPCYGAEVWQTNKVFMKWTWGFLAGVAGIDILLVLEHRHLNTKKGTRKALKNRSSTS